LRGEPVAVGRSVSPKYLVSLRRSAFEACATRSIARRRPGLLLGYHRLLSDEARSITAARAADGLYDTVQRRIVEAR